MIYLVAGLDRSTHARWNDHVMASHASVAARIARGRAADQGFDLVVAAVIGPYGSVEPFVADVRPAAQPRPEAA